MSGWLARLRRLAPAAPSPQPSSTASSKLPLEYEADGVKTWSKQLDFLTDERFLSAYSRGANSGYSYLEGQQPFDLRWRVSVTCWAAFEIAPEPAGHGLPLSKCEAYNRVYEQPCGSS